MISNPITLLNIPNYYSSYYLYGLSRVTELRYLPNHEYQRWNGLPIIIFKSKGKIVVIDNQDPMGIQQKLYNNCDFYFVTNKLVKDIQYNQSRIFPLFPHYPIDCAFTYLKIFGFHWYQTLGLERAVKDIYAQKRRLPYKNIKPQITGEPYIFFSGSIWKKENHANRDRTNFIKACKEHSRIDFEGGLVSRMDNLGLDEVVGPKRYSAKEFYKKSAKSFINFNNPAVLGALSWRFGEYLNMGTFVLSLPLHVDLPKLPEHGKEIHFIQDTNEVKEFLSFLIRNKGYHHKISEGGKIYFNENCKPESQAMKILSIIN